MKKKILTSCLAVALAAIMLTGATLAYFTDKKTVTNTFTAGNVEIKLDEAEVIYNDENDKYEENSEKRVQENTYSEIFPGVVLPKDPTVENTGTEDAYIVAQVTVTNADLMKLLGVDNEYVGLWDFVTGGVSTKNVKPYDANSYTSYTTVKENQVSLKKGWLCEFGSGEDTVKYYLTQENDMSENKTGQEVTYTFTYYFEEPLKGAKAAEGGNAAVSGGAIELFEELHIDKKWTNDQMKLLNGMNIKVVAYAIQEDGFDNVYKACKEAFPNVME